MVHRYEKRSDILKVTSGGRAQIKNVKNDKPSDVQLTSPNRCTDFYRFFGIFKHPKSI